MTRRPGNAAPSPWLMRFCIRCLMAVFCDVEGVRYMVVDCGGGTVDITVHEMDSKTGKLNELHKATGGPHGSAGMSNFHSGTTSRLC